MNDVDNMMTPHRQSVLRWQRWQDFFFEKTTMVFALTTLVALTGIIVSLFISSWPVLTTFGFEFFYTIEWDIINSKFGGLIAIFGTVATASIAILIALPLSCWRQCHPSSTACLVCLFSRLCLLNMFSQLWLQPWVKFLALVFCLQVPSMASVFWQLA